MWSRLGSSAAAVARPVHTAAAPAARRLLRTSNIAAATWRLQSPNVTTRSCASLHSLTKKQCTLSLPARLPAICTRTLHTHSRTLQAQESPAFAGASNAQQPTLSAAEPHKHTPKSPRGRKTLRWLLRIVGGSALLFGAYGVYLMRHEEERTWQLLVWKTLPLRFLSYLWGSVHRLELPVFLRKPLYMAWTRAFNCDLSEMEGGPECLEDFPNLNSFFIRRIDLARVRPLDSAEMVSPVDARVNCFGEVRAGGVVQQIKGMDYRVEDLLGHALPKLAPDEKMYYYVLYLAPGDYHRMHAPMECVVAERRHFPGALYPVAPRIARYIPSCFVRNERVVLSGSWAHGFMALVPVGAYNVGSMKLTFDEELDTNLRAHTFTEYRPSLDDGLRSQPFFKSYRKDMRQSDVIKATDEFARSDPAIDPHTFTHPHTHAPGQARGGGVPSHACPVANADAAVAAAEAAPHDAHPHGKPGVGGLSPSRASELGAAAGEVGQEVMRVSEAGIHLRKGAEFSRFELGSTIVVLFQLDKGQTFNFNIEEDQKVKLGQRIGVILPPARGTQR